MKILWIVNTIFPYPSKMLKINNNVFGGWMLSLMDEIKKKREIKLAVATVYNGKELLMYENDNVIYYLLPCKNNYKYDTDLEKYWKDVNNDFNPDLVHLHGTEFAHGLAFINACPNVKIVTSIQGLVSLCGNKYLLGISYKDILKSITFRDIVRMDNMFQARKKFINRGKNEIKILNRADIIIGRTALDYSAVMSITDVSKYRKCNESLRNMFYDVRWDYSTIDNYSILISQASYPIKGFHEMVKALPIIKKYYPNVKVYVAGQNIIDKTTFKNRIKLSGYAKYLIKLMKKYDVINDIKFIGLLSEQEMVEKMLKCNVFVQTSIIENSSNSLGEAMLLGMPIVASNVGGTSDMLVDKLEGYLYPYGEETLLAKYIVDIFNDKNRSIELGNNARNHAKKTHNRVMNANDMICIYRSIVDEFEK